MSIRIHAALAAAVALSALVGVAEARSIVGITVANDSSPNPAADNRFFDTASFLSPVTTTGSTVSFTHRMAAYNFHQGLGGVAQTNKRNVIFQIDLTVQDPGSVGFTIDLEGIIRNISTLNLNSTVGGISSATGLALGATYNDSTMDPGVFQNLPLPLLGQSTPGLGNITEPGAYGQFRESTANATLGSYVGTTSFSFRFTTLPTATTNVIFANNSLGDGTVNLGLGPIPDGFEDVNADDLGHFFTVSATFVPGPGSAGLLALAGLGMARRRRARG